MHGMAARGPAQLGMDDVPLWASPRGRAADLTSCRGDICQASPLAASGGAGGGSASGPGGSDVADSGVCSARGSAVCASDIHSAVGAIGARARSARCDVVPAGHAAWILHLVRVDWFILHFHQVLALPVQPGHANQSLMAQLATERTVAVVGGSML